MADPKQNFARLRHLAHLAVPTQHHPVHGRVQAVVHQPRLLRGNKRHGPAMFVFNPLKRLSADHPPLHQAGRPFQILFRKIGARLQFREGCPRLRIVKPPENLAA